MRMDTHTVGAWLEEVCQGGIVLDHKILAWKQADIQEKPAPPDRQRQATKAS